MDGQVGDALAEHPQNAQVLDDDGVDADAAGVGGHLGRAGEFPVGEEGVQGEVDLAPPQVAVGHHLFHLLPGEIFRVAPGVEIPVAQIDGVRPVLHGGGHRLHGPGGGEQFQHGVPPFTGFNQAARPGRTA